MFGSKPFGSSTTNTFGSSTGGSSLFGQNKPATSVFGSQPAQQQQQTGGLFGSTQAKPSIFGSPAANTSSTNLFGSPSTAANTGSSLFGASKPAGGGLFGSSTPTQSTFGASTGGGGGLFGSSTTAGSSMFGASTPTQSGTTVKFDPPVASDTMVKNGSTQNINTKHMCITAMKAYETKSIEELRVDDYMANRKAPQAGSTSGGGGLFGSSTAATPAASTGGLFGQSAQSKSLFGGSTTTNTFGSPAASTGTSLFGSSTPAANTSGSSLFGAKPAATGGLFGSTATGGSTFGAPASNTSGGLFGSGAATTGATFGSQPAQTGGLFGSTAAPAQTAGFSFGAATTAPATNAFGAAAAPAATGGLFGSTAAPAAAGSSLFGAKPAAATGGFSFGNTAAAAPSTFGAATQPAAGGGLFGNTAAKPGGLFGSTTTQPAGGGLFGSQPAQPAAGGLFGAQPAAQPAGGLFGAPAATAATAAPAQVVVPAAAPIVLGSDVSQLQVQMALIDAQLAASPYGDSPLLKLSGATGKDSDDKPNPTSVQRQMRFLASKSVNGASPSSPAVAGSPLTRVQLPAVGSKVLDVSRGASKLRSPAVMKDLAYSPSVAPPTLGRGLRTTTAAMNNSALAASRTKNASMLNSSAIDAAVDVSLSGGANRMPGSAGRRNVKHLDASVIGEVMAGRGMCPRDPDELPSRKEAGAAASAEMANGHNVLDMLSPMADPVAAAHARGAHLREQRPPRMNLDMTSESIVTTHDVVTERTDTDTTTLSPAKSPVKSPQQGGEREKEVAAAGVRLASGDYFCEPSIALMKDMVDGDRVVLPNGLTIGRATYGSVFWPGRIELKDVVLDEIVVFRHKEVTVYPDESLKPALGQGLNRPAEVTLERVWPVEKQSGEAVRDPLRLVEMGWREKLERVSARMDANFKDYRATTGSWVFRVQHFSKYGLPDDESEDENVCPGDAAALNASLHELDVQGKVQRQGIRMKPAEAAATGLGGDGMQMTVLTDRFDDQAVPRSIGLGGGLLRTSSAFDRASRLDESCVEMEEGEGAGMDAWRQPAEKRAKMEPMETLSPYEQSERLLDKVCAPRQPLEKKMVVEERAPVRAFSSHLGLSQSAIADKAGVIDVAASHGRSCRVGWAVGGLSVRSLLPARNGVSLVSQPCAEEVDSETLTDLLEHNQRLSVVVRRNPSTSARMRHDEIEGQIAAPRRKPSEEHAELIDSFIATAEQDNRDAEQRLWKLCQALFPAHKTDNDSWLWRRREAVGEWLRAETRNMVVKESAAGGQKAGQVWRELCRGDLDAAVSSAADAGLVHLASMLAVFTVDVDCTREYFDEQITAWERNASLHLVETALLKCYLVMAGRRSAERAMSGGARETVDVLDGLTWQQSLGVHVWWLGGGWATSLEVAARMFDEAGARGSGLADGHAHWQLIRLAVDRSVAVEEVLDAVRALGSEGDWHLCWHTWTVLRSTGYNHMSAEAEQRMHRSYAEQLCSAGLPVMAAFVLQHIANDQRRSSCLLELVERTVEESEVNEMRELVELPAQWVARADMLRAKLAGDTTGECRAALAAGELSHAHQLFFDHVAPTCIALEELAELSELCRVFEPYAERIAGWGAGGQLYCEYVCMRAALEEDDLDRVHEMVQCVVQRVQAPVFDTPVKRLAVRTISREVMEIRHLAFQQHDLDMPHVDVMQQMEYIQPLDME